MTRTRKTINLLVRILFWVYLIIAVRLLVLKAFPMGLALSYMRADWERGVILRGLSTANFIPFETVIMYIKHYGHLNSFENLVGNIVIFIPFGFLAPFVKSERKRGLAFVMAMGFLISMLVEVIQLVTGFGAFDVDDLILNTLGTVIGYCLYKVVMAIVSKVSKSEQ